jgi:hypothetical protein
MTSHPPQQTDRNKHRYGIFNGGEDTPFKTNRGRLDVAERQVVQIFSGHKENMQVVAATVLEADQRVEEIHFQ